jgi:hypothetical protein
MALSPGPLKAPRRRSVAVDDNHVMMARMVYDHHVVVMLNDDRPGIGLCRSERQRSAKQQCNGNGRDDILHDKPPSCLAAVNVQLAGFVPLIEQQFCSDLKEVNGYQIDLSGTITFRAPGRWFHRLALIHICAPIIHGTNSSSPIPSASLRLFSPEATRSIISNISVPFSEIVAVPSMISPQLTSMSSLIRLNIGVLVAILIEGAGLAPKQEPRPVVKSTIFAPLAICPVAPMGS